MNKLFKKLFAPIAIFAMALGVTISVNNHHEVVGAEAATANWVLVTSINDFVDGGEYLFTHSGTTSYMVPGAYTGSNPTSAALDLNTIARNQAWTLDNVGTNQWQIFNGSNYLKIQTNTTSGLRTQATVPSTHFTITTGADINTFKFPTSSSGGRAPARYTGGSDWRSYSTSDAATSLTIYKYVDIAVSPLTNLTKSGTLAKTEYYVNDAFDPTGLIFTATYQDAHTAVVTSSVTYNPSVMAANTTQVIASYTENSVTKSVTITGITVTVPQWSVATYTISAKNTFTTTGDVPTGSSAAITETYSTSKQMTANNSQTVTLTNYKHIIITQITLSAHSNTSAGSGSLSYSLDGGSSFTDIIPTSTFSNASWYGSWSVPYVDVVKSVSILVSSSVIFKVAATVNSLFVESYDIRWEVDPDYVAAQTFANDVMTGVGANANGDCAAVLSQLETSYSGLNSNAKVDFDSLSETLFVNARARMAYLTAWVNPASPSGRQILTTTTSYNLVAVITIGAIALTSLLSYYIINKKKLLG